MATTGSGDGHEGDERTAIDDLDDIIDSEEEARQLQQAMEYETEREERLQKALEDRKGLTWFIARIERWVDQIHSNVRHLTRAIRDLVQTYDADREETRKLRDELRQALQRFDLMAGAPIETIPAQQPGSLQPWTQDKWGQRIHGPDGKQAKWVALALAAAALLVFGAYRLGFTASDFRPGSTPSPSLELPVESHGDSG